MKKSLLTLNLIIFFFVNISFAQSFNTKTETVFEASNNTNIVFIDEANKTPYYATNKNGAWKYEKLTYFDDSYNETVKTSSFPNIAIDKKDNISIVMFGRYKENLIYATKHISTNGWKFSNTKATSHLQKFLVYAEYTDMCTDKNGGLHVICNADFWDKSGKKHDQSAVYFYKPVSGKWQVQAILKGVVNKYIYGKHSSIATYDNKVYASIGGSKNLNFVSKNISGGQWKYEQLFDIQDNMNTWKFETSLCISPNGSLNFAFYEYYAENNYKYHGLNIMQKSKCGKSDWKIDQTIPENEYKRSPAMGIDNNGKTYIAFGGKELYLFTKTCECTQKWQQIYKDDKINCDYTDMVIDKQNNVHVFYAYKKKVYHLEAKPQSSTKKCNYRPSISFVGKTNLKIGEKWSAKIYANDPECDPTEIYSINMPKGFTLNDHKNGTATISGTVNEVKEHIFTVFCKDNKHLGSDSKNSAVTIKLQVGAKGSIKYKNNCTGNSQTIKISGNLSNNNSGNININGNSKINTTSKTGGNDDCEKFIKRYETFANKYVPIAKKVILNFIIFGYKKQYKLRRFF